MNIDNKNMANDINNANANTKAKNTLNCLDSSHNHEKILLALDKVTEDIENLDTAGEKSLDKKIETVDKYISRLEKKEVDNQKMLKKLTGIITDLKKEVTSQRGEIRERLEDLTGDISSVTI